LTPYCGPKDWERSQCIGLLILLIGLSLTCGISTAAGNPSTDFTQLLDEVWEFDLSEDPLSATDIGDHRFDDKLPKISLEDEERRASAITQFLERLSRIDRNALASDGQVNYDIFKRRLQNQLRGYELKSHLMPITDRYGFHVQFADLAENASLFTTEDCENYIARLRGFKAYSAGYIELMREGLRQGMTVPSEIMQHFAEPLEAQIVDDPEKSLFYKPLAKLSNSIPAEERRRLQDSAREAIIEGIVPGYRQFYEFMRDEYVPGCRGSIAASALPNGREYYRHCAQRFTTLDDMTPEELHATGKAEVARIRGEMDQIIESVGFEGDFAAFVEYLRTDPKFYAKSSDDLVSRASAILKRMDGELPTLFGRLPRTPYGIKEIPSFIAPQATAAYYMPSPGDGRRAGFFYINTYDLSSRPLYMLDSLCLHEAVPGHHLQLALQKELDSLPNFRKYGSITAFVEGWALYAERLGLEASFYADPYSNFGRLSMEMWRACRLVVDTGIHYFGWSKNKAIDYMKSNSAMPMHDIRAEVNRYIGWPGQALAYKTGELKIRELRREAEEQLQDDFDLREFHDVVLGGGSVPLNVLETNVRNWIENSIHRQAKAP
jgi:uncharacterized protein (DUF885 family)